MLNTRAIYLEEIAQSREEAFDFYVFVRSAYLQNRAHRLAGGAGDGRSGPFGGAPATEGAEPEEDLYYFDEEFDEEELEEEELDEKELDQEELDQDESDDEALDDEIESSGEEKLRGGT
jgi:hypothetical protein